MRRELVRALTSAGLVNYPTEWWHWSYGDRYWAHVTGSPHALFGAVDDPTLSDRSGSTPPTAGRPEACRSSPTRPTSRRSPTSTPISGHLPRRPRRPRRRVAATRRRRHRLRPPRGVRRRHRRTTRARPRSPRARRRTAARTAPPSRCRRARRRRGATACSSAAVVTAVGLVSVLVLGACCGPTAVPTSWSTGRATTPCQNGDRGATDASPHRRLGDRPSLPTPSRDPRCR